MYFANVYFAEFEQVSVYIRNFDVWSLKLLNSFILIYWNYSMGDGNKFHKNFFNFSNYNEKRKTSFGFQFQCSVILKIEKPFSFMFHVSTLV